MQHTAIAGAHVCILAFPILSIVLANSIATVWHFVPLINALGVSQGWIAVDPG